MSILVAWIEKFRKQRGRVVWLFGVGIVWTSHLAAQAPDGDVELNGATFGLGTIDFSEGPGDNQYSGSGSASFDFDDQSLTLSVPENGLVLERQGDSFELISIGASVAADIELFGLELSINEDNPLTFLYDTGSDSYQLYGEVDLVIEEQELDAFLGDSDTPGLVISGGTLESLNIGVSTGFEVGGFSFESPDDNPFTVTYDRAEDTYTLSGTAELDSLWDTIIELGSQDHPGIVITDNRWDIEDLAIEIDSIDLGFAELNELRVEYSRDVGDDIEVEIELDVSIPELEIEVAGDVRVDNGRITDIFTDFQAVGTTEGLEILDTGLDIAELGLSLQNLDQPADLILTGSIGIEFGGQLSIAGETVTLAYIEGDVYIDADELQLTDTIFYGAYEDDDGEWTSVIYEGSANLDLNWTRGVYSLSGEIRMPTDYGIRISESLRFGNESIVLEAEADVRVPDGIPIIGGDNLGTIDADLLIDMRDSTKSFAAGWVTIDLLFTSEQAGIKYKFHSGDIDYISSGDIADIKDEIKDAEAANSTITKHYTFDIPDGATSFVIDFDWYLDPFPLAPAEARLPLPEMIISGQGNVVGPDGSTGTSALSLHQLNYSSPGQYLALPDDLITVVTESFGTTFSSEGLIVTDPVIGQELGFLAIGPGEVTISLTYDRGYDSLLTIDTPTLTVYYDYPDPTISLDGVSLNEANSETSDGVTTLFTGRTLPIDLTYFTDAAFAQETTIGLYLDTNNRGYNGHRVGDEIRYTNPSITDPFSNRVDWTIENVTGDPTDEFYLYARLDNQNQSVVYTEYLGPYTIAPAVFGVVFDVSQAFPLDGFRVYIDENGNGKYDSKHDRSTITDTRGIYAFGAVDEGDLTIGVVVPKGFATNSTKLDLVNRTYVSGDSLEVDFDLVQLTSISGVVFEDANENGLQDSDESGIGGVTLYIDSDGNGTYIPGFDVSTISNNKGEWTFHDLDPETTYVINVFAFGEQLTTEETSFVVNTSSAGSQGLQRAMNREGIFTDFGGHSIGVKSGSVPEVTDQRYMTFATVFFNGQDGDHLLAADPDGDGISNELERILGTDPTEFDGGTIFEFGTFGEGGFELIMEQVDRQFYTVQRSGDLERWEDLRRFRAEETGPIRLEFSAEEMGNPSFIRVLVQD